VKSSIKFLTSHEQKKKRERDPEIRGREPSGYCQRFTKRISSESTKTEMTNQVSTAETNAGGREQAGKGELEQNN